ncbi:MAG: LytTR family DNA-binding domain-containing protein [Bacteroidota bacterium]
MSTNFQGMSVIIVTARNESHPLEISTIMYCESCGDYTKFYGENSLPVTACGWLKTHEEKLSSHGFIRIHHKYLVNPQYIKRFPYRSPDNQVFLSNGTILKVSRQKKKSAYQKLKKYCEG